MFTAEDGWVWTFAAVDHWNAECVGWHVCKVGSRFAALEPLAQGLGRLYGSVEADVARGLALRMDHGSQYLSDHFLNQIRYWGARNCGRGRGAYHDAYTPSSAEIPSRIRSTSRPQRDLAVRLCKAGLVGTTAPNLQSICARKGFYSDEDEADLNRLIEAELTAVDDTAPAVTITGPATEPVIGPFPITVVFSEPVTGFELKDLVVGNGVASELERDGARYAATVTPTAPGPVTVDIAAGAAEDSAGNPSTAAEQFSITVELTPVPALPVAGVIALAALLLIGVIRRRNQNQYLATTGGRGSPYFWG